MSTTTTTTATAAAIGATSSSLRYLPSLHYHLLERAETHLICLCVSSSSTRRRRPPAPYCHTPPLTLPLQLAHARVPAATSMHVTVGTAQHTHTRRQLPPLNRFGVARAPCTGLASLGPLRTHRNAAAIALASLAARMQLFLVLDHCPLSSLAGTLLFSLLRHASPRQLARTFFAARLPR